ncbi:MAG: hypothetical protein KAX55_05610 [Propionivibrio sp.]|nr:hypothetical protein [Propionivibrio sp.]
MAAGTLFSILANIPWGQVVDNAPVIAESAVKLWKAARRKKSAQSPDQDSEADAAQTGRGSLNERLVAMEEHIRSLEEQMSTSAELIKALAEQNALLVRRFELNNTRLRRLAVATAIGGVVLLGSIAYLLFGT